ncbi:MAG TPA: transporter substrate-binding domain-containing protein [Rhodocyclaceae bacterium]|nr:transporter substrate-binding domain-containing protein [Rhodocyclaceae bacterium]
MAPIRLFHHRDWVRRLAAVLLAAAAAAGPAAAGEPLRFNTGVGAPYIQGDRKGFLDLLVPELFRRLGLEAEAVGYPASERAMMNANNGLDDGVAMRVKGLEAGYPNLIRVEEKVIDNDFVAYSRHHAFPAPGFEALKPYQVGYIVGWKVFESRLEGGYSLTRVQDADQLFNLLANDRADVVLFERWQGNWLVRERRLPVKLLLPPLVTTEMFMYVHRKHAHLAEPIARALRAMKADGTYRRLVEQSLQIPDPR